MVGSSQTRPNLYIITNNRSAGIVKWPTNSHAHCPTSVR